jgi:hypothetical protein
MPIVRIYNPGSPVQHVSMKQQPMVAIEYAGNYGKPRYGRIVKEDRDFIVLEEFHTCDTFRIGVPCVREISNVNIVTLVTDVTQHAHFNENNTVQQYTEFFALRECERASHVNDSAGGSSRPNYFLKIRE